MAMQIINKIDAARRQIDASIRMTFAGEDFVAVHTVISAGHRIVRDLCEKQGDVISYIEFKDWINLEYEAEFWRHANASANFLKHALSDTSNSLEMDDETSDHMILFASKWYKDLGNSPSIEMNIFATWFMMCHPSTLKAESSLRSPDWNELIEDFKIMSRDERLKIGWASLDQARSGLGLKGKR